jgi:hypothetical protein
MSINLENKIKILEYKLAYEQEKQTSKEFEEGSIDLNYRLSFFREEIKKNIPKHDTQQKNVYDSIFPSHDKTKPANIVISNDDETAQKSLQKNNNIDRWAKKVYIRIIKSTHPDITMHINSKDIRTKFDKIYDIAQNAYENNILSDLIMTAYELEIEVPNDVIQENIVSSFKGKQEAINKFKNMIGWQWYHVPDSNKDAELKKILTSLGFKFTDNKIKSVIKSRRPQRKTGKRPEKLSVKRKRLK